MNPIVKYQFDFSHVPAAGTIQEAINALAAVVAVAVLGFLLFSVGAWVAGGHSGNIHALERGKSGVVRALVGALLLGGSAFLVNFFINWGQAAHQ